MVANWAIYSFEIRKFTVLLKAFETLLLLRLCLYTHAHRGMHVHHTQSLYSHSINLHAVSTLEHITEHCCSPKTRSSFKKDKPWRAEHGVDPEIPLFPLLDATDSIIKQIVCSRDRPAQSYLKDGLQSFPLLPPRDLSSGQQRNFEGPDPYFPACTQKRRHITVCYSHILIYTYVFVVFSNPEGAPSFLLSNIPAISTRTRHSTNSSPSRS